jgi:hypothetical protein
MASGKARPVRASGAAAANYGKILNTKKHLTIALDAMGGDQGPDMVIPGAALSSVRHPDLRFLLVGDRSRIAPLLERHPRLKERAEILHTDVFVAMDTKPSQALRQGRGKSSMWLAIDAVKSGAADAAVSAGNTGALMAMARFILKTLPGIQRPAIAAIWPIVFATAAGVRRIDPAWLKVTRNLGASPVATLAAVILPAIAQDVFTGMRLALGVAWIVLVPAEYLGVTSGLGYAINDARDTLEYDRLAATVLVIGLIGFALDLILQQLIKRASWLRQE